MFSVRLKLTLSFLLLAGILLGLLNTYPVLVSRDLVADAKQSSMKSQASVMTSSLSALDSLSAESVAQVMELLDVMPLTRILITDPSGIILYDTSQEDNAVGRYALFREISVALTGRTVFHAIYSGEAFITRQAMPVLSGNTVIGAVYLYEYDASQSDIIAGLQKNLRNISLAVSALALMLIVVFSTTLTRRIQRLAAAVKVVRGGNYAHRVDVRGNDELSELSAEFNILTGRLESTEEARRRFVSDASHELRTPLAAIRLLSDSITQTEQMDDKTMREFVADIGSEAERLQRTTEKLMNLTRLDAGVTVAKKEVTDFAAVIRRTLHLLEPLAATRDVSIRTELEEGCLIYANADDLYQIVFNLAENGVKYNRDGGSVSLRLQKDGAAARLTVSDTGIGIPEEDLRHIFDRFYRVDKARSRASGGSGLGLSIVYASVEANGGTVDVTSRFGEGTEFTLSFPLCREEAIS